MTTGPAAAPPPRLGVVARGPATLILFLACAVLAANILTYSFVLPDGRHLFISDDSLISLRYADRFLHGKGLTWNDHEPPLEGYSNLLWVLAVSALGWLGIDLILATRILGCLGMAAVLAAVVAAYPPRRPADEASPPLAATVLPPLFAALALAVTGPIAIWAIGGLEQPLLAALLAWALVLLFPVVDGREVSHRALLVPGLLFGLIVLTRPDGALFAAVAGLALAIQGRFRRPALLRAAALAALPAAFYLGQLGFRLAYYGDWFPNSAYAKIAFSVGQVKTGLFYVSLGLSNLVPLFVPGVAAVAGALLAGSRTGRTLLLTAVSIVWLLYVVVVGGDIFPGWRHLVALTVPAALLAAGGLEWLLLAPGRQRWAAWPVSAALLTLLAFQQSSDVVNVRARHERWEWDGQVVGRLLRAAFGAQQPLLAVDPAGCLPYFSGLPSIDMMGINDRWIARHPPADFGDGSVGHELGDANYVLGRNPDLVLFRLPKGGPPAFRSGEQMVRDPRFFQTFQPVVFEGTDPREVQSLIWVRREGGRIGIRREGRRVSVPGFLLAAWPDRRASPLGDPWLPRVDIGSGVLDGAGKIGCLVRAGMPYALSELPLAAGTWKIAVSPPGAGVRVTARSGSLGSQPGARDDECTIAVPADGNGRIEISVATASTPGSHVRSLVLDKLGEP